jgi:opacity protein-like surface antigen
MKNSFLVLLLCSAPVYATTNQLDFTWGRSSPLGTIQAQGSTEQDGLRGTSWSLDALHQTSDRFYLGFGFGHFASAVNNSTTFLANTTTTISSWKTSSLLLGRLDLSKTNHFVTYAIAGLGWVKNSLNVTSAQGTIVDDSKTTLGYGGGLGLEVLITQALLIGLEARYEGSPEQHFGMTALGTASSGQTDVKTSISVFNVGLKAGIRY